MAMELKSVFTGIRPDVLKMLTPEQQESVKYLPEKYLKVLDTLLGRKKERAEGVKYQMYDEESIGSRIRIIIGTAKLMQEKAQDMKAQARGEDSALVKSATEILETSSSLATTSQ